MAMNSMKQTAIIRAFRASRVVIGQLKPIIEELDVLYNTATTGIGATLTQADLDAVPSFSGITKQQVDDVFFALTATMKNAVATGYDAMAEGSGRADMASLG